VVGHRVRLLTGVTLICALALWAASVATADTQYGSQDPTVTVSASLLSSGADPNVARAGDTVYANVTMDSNVDTTSTVRVFVFGDLDGTKLSFDRTKIRKLRPDNTWDWSSKITVPAGTAPGVYHLTIVANTAGTLLESRAEATITVA
jgi:uncharacterized protein YfaS (alpha-2-macroglobulin family)